MRLLSKQDILNLNIDSTIVCGIYFLIKNGSIVYVGQSINIQSRLKSHLGDKDFDSFRFIYVSQHLLNCIEFLYIHEFEPILNARHSSGKIVAPISSSELQGIRKTLGIIDRELMSEKIDNLRHENKTLIQKLDDNTIYTEILRDKINKLSKKEGEFIFRIEKIESKSINLLLCIFFICFLSLSLTSIFPGILNKYLTVFDVFSGCFLMVIFLFYSIKKIANGHFV